MYVEFMTGITVARNDSDKGNSKNGKIPLKDKCIITIMLVTMLLAIIGAAPVLWDLISPGEVRPIPPSGYSIIRGVESFSFPSDHIVLPIDWEYTGGTPAVITHPYLVFREIDDNGNEIGKEYNFLWQECILTFHLTLLKNAISLKNRSFSTLIRSHQL
jgi:hypothetical protein